MCSDGIAANWFAIAAAPAGTLASLPHQPQFPYAARVS